MYSLWIYGKPRGADVLTMVLLSSFNRLFRMHVSLQLWSIPKEAEKESVEGRRHCYRRLKIFGSSVGRSMPVGLEGLICNGCEGWDERSGYTWMMAREQMVGMRGCDRPFDGKIICCYLPQNCTREVRTSGELHNRMENDQGVGRPLTLTARFSPCSLILPVGPGE